MHFARTEEQAYLANLTRDLLGKHSDSAAVRAAQNTDLGYDSKLWQLLAEQVGVGALPIPENFAGAGFGLIETGVIFEELGYSLAPSPILGNTLLTVALLLAGDENQKQSLLPELASGATGALAGLGFATNTDLVIDGFAAELVYGMADNKLVALSPATAQPTMDQSLRLGKLAAPTINDPVLTAIGQCLTAIQSVGVAQRGLDMTVAYSKERIQFGRQIGSFQALKHRMADMLVLVEAGRSAAWAAVALAANYLETSNEANHAELIKTARVAKTYCTKMGREVASETIQLHGGIAITWEHDAHLVFKRLHSLNTIFVG